MRTRGRSRKNAVRRIRAKRTGVRTNAAPAMANQVVQVQRGLMPFADNYKVRLRYCDRPQLTTTGSVNTAVVYSFRLGSLFDPDYTGTGHQPYMYDQLTSVYNKYIVEEVEWHVRFRQIAASPLTTLWCGLSLITDTNVAASASGDTLNEIRERSTALTAPLAAVNNSSNFKSWRGKVSLRKLFGLSAAQYYGDQEDFAALYNANPSRQCFLELFLIDPDSGSSTTVEADVELVYHAKMFGFVAPAQS